MQDGLESDPAEYEPAGPSTLLSRSTSQSFLGQDGRLQRAAKPDTQPPTPVFSSSPPKYSSPVKKEDRVSIFDSPASHVGNSFAQPRSVVPEAANFIDLDDFDDDAGFPDNFGGVIGGNSWQDSSQSPYVKQQLPWLKGEGRHSQLYIPSGALKVLEITQSRGWK